MNKNRKAMESLNRLLESKHVAGATKLRLYRKIIRPVAYGCETWVLAKKNEMTLEV